MNTEVQTYLEYLETLRGRARAAIEGMGVEELNWAPLNANANSPCALASHIAGAETMWIHQLVGGLDVPRNREAEFAATSHSAATLVDLLDKVGVTSRKVLSNLDGDQLEKTRARPGRSDAQTVTVRDSIVRMIAHLAEHVGHLELTRQLYGERIGNDGSPAFV